MSKSDFLKGQLSNKQLALTISTEALMVHRPNAGTVNKLSNFLTNVSRDIKSSLAAGVVDNILGTTLRKEGLVDKLGDKLEKVSYMDIQGIRVPVTPGLQVPWLTLLDSMDWGLRFSVNFYDEFLSPFQRYIAMANSNPEEFSKAIAKNSPEFMERIDFDGQRAIIGKAIGANNKLMVQTLGKCAARNADILTTVDRTAEYAEALKNANQQMVNDAITDIKNSLSRLSDNILDSNQSYRMTGQNIAKIASVTFSAAQGIEFYGVMLALFTSHAKAMDDTVEKLTRVL